MTIFVKKPKVLDRLTAPAKTDAVVVQQGSNVYHSLVGELPDLEGVTDFRQCISIACTNLTSAVTTGTKVTFRIPYAFRVTGVVASLGTAQSTGNVLTLNVAASGSTLFTTKLTFDNGSKTTVGADKEHVFLTTLLADDAEITVSVDQVGDALARGLVLHLLGYPEDGSKKSAIILAVTDETTALAAGAGAYSFHTPYGFTISEVRASLTAAQSSGSILTVDLNQAGTSIFTTRLSVDNSERTSKTAATPAVLANYDLLADSNITVDIDQVGTGGAGLKIYFIGTIATGNASQCFFVSCDDRATAITAGTAKARFTIPFDFTVTGVKADLAVAQTSGSLLTIDVNKAAVSILSTKLTIDNTFKTSATATTPAVISDYYIPAGSEITVDVDTVGTGTPTGLTVYLLGNIRTLASPVEKQIRGLSFVADTSTITDADPGAGKFKWNNATQTSSTTLFFDNATSDGVTVTNFYASLLGGGFLSIQQASDEARWQLWRVSKFTAASGYYKMDVSLVANGKTISTGSKCYALFQAGGAQLRGLTFTSDTASQADSDPGAGLLRWNNATQGSATQLFIDNSTADAVSVSTFWASLGPSGFIYMQQGDDSTKWQLWKWTATPTNGTGYYKFAVTLQASGGSIDNTKTVYMTFDGAFGSSSVTQCIPIACSDETTPLTTGTAKVTFRMPYAFTLTAVRASVTTAPTGGTLLTVDINEGGTTILSTKLTFDAGEKTTTTAATPPVISDSSLADDAEMTIDIDAIGSTIAGAGLKVYLIGYKT